MGIREVALIGARGMGHHGGFETIVSELGPRLSENGYQVFCSNRRTENLPAPREYRGVSLMYFPVRFPRKYSVAKFFEVLYDWYFALKCTFQMNCDIAYFLGVGVGLAIIPARLSKSTLVVNIDGLEWKRAKFSPVARAFLKLSFYVVCVAADCIIMDNAKLVDHIPKRFREKAVCIVNGVTVEECASWTPSRDDHLGESDSSVNPGEYILVVARLEPENNIHTIVKAYLACDCRKPLVIVGDFSAESYGDEVDSLTRALPEGKRIVRAGSIYDRERLHVLRCHCAAYIHGHSVGGTNPSLLEAMAVGNAVIAHDNSFNREVCREHALYFQDVSTLAKCIDDVDGNPGYYRNEGRILRAIAEERYNWDLVTTAYDELFRRFVTSDL